MGTNIILEQNTDKHLILIYKQLEFITRIYALDSKKYNAESRYWSVYAYRVGHAISQEKVSENEVNVLGRIDFMG